MSRAVVLVDGEHYPPVTLQAVEALKQRGYDVVAAVFAGGGEKLSKPLDLGELPIIRGDNVFDALDEAVTTHSPEVVYDLSDDPVVDHSTRMLLAAVALAAGVAYEAPGFAMTPPRSIQASLPTIAVIGTGKRCGKTAVSAHVARTLAAAGSKPVIVAMGRGGPARPVLVRGDTDPPDAATLLTISERGEHAASDVYEDAVIARVPVVGARRAGAGPAGQTVLDTVEEATRMAEKAGDIIILEGSGTAVPPVGADATILVAREGDDPAAWPAANRILLADLVLVRMPSEEVIETRQVSNQVSNISALTSPNREQPPVVPVILRPTPLESVEGRKIFVTTTAPEAAGSAIRAQLEQAHGATLVGISHRLADRAGLAEDLRAAAGKYEVLVCELKAAAVDVAVREAIAAGATIVFLDNRPVAVQGDLEAAIREIERTARSRFSNR